MLLKITVEQFDLTFYILFIETQFTGYHNTMDITISTIMEMLIICIHCFCPYAIVQVV